MFQAILADDEDSYEKDTERSDKNNNEIIG